MKKSLYKVIAFRAVDEPELCSEFIKGHNKTLNEYNLTKIIADNNTWVNNPNSYCLGLINKKNKLLAGIKIQLANGKTPLPIELAISYMEPKINVLVQHYYSNGGIGEVSGLWVDNRLKGLGIGWYMTRAAIASSNQFNVKTLIGISADVSLNIFHNVGFVIEETLGKNGHHLYPYKDLVAHTIGLINVTTLDSTAIYDKKIIKSLQRKHTQTRIENDKNKEVSIDYNIKYKNDI